MSTETLEVIGMGCAFVLASAFAVVPVWIILTRSFRGPRG